MQVVHNARHLLGSFGEVMVLPPQRSEFVVLFGKVWFHFRTATGKSSRHCIIECFLRCTQWIGYKSWDEIECELYSSKIRPIFRPKLGRDEIILFLRIEGILSLHPVNVGHTTTCSYFRSRWGGAEMSQHLMGYQYPGQNNKQKEVC